MLYLYQNVNPNYDNDIHYYFDDFSAYKSSLSNKLFTTLSVDNYRIDTEVCKIGFNESITALSAQSITYIIDERDSYKRCYYVRSYIIMSNMIIFRLEIDYWGSFIDTCKLSDMWVKRCNRQIDTPVFDSALTHGNPSIEYMYLDGLTFPPITEVSSDIKKGEYIAPTALTLIFAISYNTDEALGASVTESRLFGVNVTSTDNLDDLIEKYGGLYSVIISSGSSTRENMASITGAWLIDKCNVELLGTNSRSFKFRTPSGSSRTETLFLVNIKNTYERVYGNIDTSPSYVYYFGTYNNNMKLKPYKTHNLKIRYVLSNDHVNVIACDGDMQEDITSAFAISLSTTNGEMRESRLLTQQLQNGLRLVTGGLGIMGGNAIGAMQGATSMVSDVIGMSDKWRNADRVGNVKSGDGYSTYNHTYNSTYGGFKNPIVLLKYSVLQYGSRHVERYGASFDKYIEIYSSLSEITSYSFIISNPRFTYTYLLANVDVSEVPVEACDSIRNTFARGVKLEFIN